MKPVISVFYKRLFIVLLSVFSGIFVLSTALLLIFLDLWVIFSVIQVLSLCAVTFVLLEISSYKVAFHRSQLCRGGICEYDFRGEKKIKAIAWSNVAFVTVVNDFMTKQKWICFSKKRMTSEQSRDPLRQSKKCSHFILYPYSETAYEVAVNEVQKHKKIS